MKKGALGLMLSALMLLSAALPASAADITVDGSAGSYSAYRLLNLTTSLKTDEAVHAGHAEGQHGSDCYNYAYTVNEKYAAVLEAAMPDDLSWDTDGDRTASEAEIVAYLTTLSDNSDGIRVFADEVWAGISAGSVGSDATSSENAFTDVAQGYYLIAETSLSDGTDSRSLVMLDTAGQDDIEISSKEGVPWLTKKVVEHDDSEGTSAMQDAADMDADDGVRFVVNSGFPENISAYDSYAYVIHDEMVDGFVLDSESVSVKIGETEFAEGDYALVTSGLSDDCAFEIRFADIKAEAGEKSIVLTSESVVEVSYSARLSDTADLGNPGNANEAYLEFSNDPYDEDATGITPSDLVNVFAYSLTVNKVDGDMEPLSGAAFTLQKWNGTAYVDYEIQSAEADKDVFTFTGIDSGQYKLVETAPPDGYNRADDIEFIVTAEYQAESDAPALTGLSVTDLEGEAIPGFNVSFEDGTIVIAVENTTGIELPSTGGAGLYAMLAVCILAVVAGGAILFVPRKER